jgi:hypothetical protein
LFSIGVLRPCANVIAEDDSQTVSPESGEWADLRPCIARPASPSHLGSTPDQLEVQHIASAKEIDEFAASQPNMSAKIKELKRRHDPTQTEPRMRHLFLHMRRGKNEDAKREIVPLVWSLVQKVVIGNTPGHQPATLDLHGLTSSILAEMGAPDLMEPRFVAEIHADFTEKLEANDIGTKEKQRELIASYQEDSPQPISRVCKSANVLVCNSLIS